MENENSITITQVDFTKISSLLATMKAGSSDLLEEELSRAVIVDSEELPPDVVSMNSQVSFQDVETGKETIVTLVYPHEADIEANKISILTPVGSALIGLRVGQVIHWPFPNGKKRQLKVTSVLCQADSVR